MPVTCPQVLCPHPCLTPTRLLSAPTGLFLLYPGAYFLEAHSAPPLHKLNGSPHPSPDLSALPTSSLCCSLECPPLLLPCLSPLSPSPLFSALSFSFPLLSLFLPPTDRLQQEQPCTPSPGRFHGSGPNTNSPGPPTFSLALGVGLGGQMRSLPQAPQQASRPVRGRSVCLVLFPWQLAGPLPHSHP